MRKLVQGCQSRGLKRRPLLRTSSPLNPKINRELTLRLVQQTGALQLGKDPEISICAQQRSSHIFLYRGVSGLPWGVCGSKSSVMTVPNFVPRPKPDGVVLTSIMVA
jgi:hypothetical protein